MINESLIMYRISLVILFLCATSMISCLIIVIVSAIKSEKSLNKLLHQLQRRENNEVNYSSFN